VDAATALDWIGSNILTVLVIRTLPFVGYALVARRVAAHVKWIAAGSWTLAGIGLASIDPVLRLQLFEVICGFAYFGLAGCLCHVLRGACQRGTLGKLGSLCACAILFQLAPALLIGGPGRATVHIVGWELMLAAYSYVVQKTDEPEPTLRQGLFFLLVNPVLVFADRGADVQRPRLDARTLQYLFIGVLAVSAQCILLAVNGTPAMIEHVDLLSVSTVRQYGVWAAYCAAQFFMIYWGMAGVANLQSGLMRSLGFEVRDRFRWPFLARSPGEFWERWNTYVTDWFRRYVFADVATSRGLRAQRSHTRWMVATVVTFATIGIAHEYALLISRAQVHGTPTAVFFIASVVVTVWMATSRLVRRRLSALLARPGVALPLRTASRVLFVNVALIVAWLMIPALSGGTLPFSLGRLFSSGELPFPAAVQRLF
jgi:hypothetical protein